MQHATAVIDWSDRWDDEVGLWVHEGPGHTAPVADLPRVHGATSAASALLCAVSLNQGERVGVARILQALRAMQWREEGRLYGCMKWYWEEPHPVDTNASFFTGLNLLLLDRCYADRLDAASRAILQAIFEDFHVWFMHAVGEEQVYYPNKYLGDLVCAWMLCERLGVTDISALQEVMQRAAAYWQTHGWGWGEHMSDCYAHVCLHELSILLLLSRTLPEALRAEYQGLTESLLALEDRFAGGPRVPAMRSYALIETPEHVHYRALIRPATAEEFVRPPSHIGMLGHILDEYGWHALVSPQAPRAREITIPCYDGATATAWVEDDARLGSLSRFPLMAIAEYPTWGLSWQCFPISCWRAAGDWGFLQWESTEDGMVRSHPATHRHLAYLGNALTRTVSPPVVGRTYALQRGGNVLAVRIMPAIPASWECLVDRFRLVSPQVTPEVIANDSWAQLLLRYPERTISVAHLALDGGVPELQPTDFGALDWSHSYAREALQDRRCVVNIWGISLEGPITQAPRVEVETGLRAFPRSPEEASLRVQWEWPGVNWHVRIDPRAELPLIDLSAK